MKIKSWKDIKDLIDTTNISIGLGTKGGLVGILGETNAICVWRHPNGEAGLTPYGRNRAKLCAGGFSKCKGDVTKVTITEDGEKVTYPLCANCQAFIELKAKTCGICGSLYKGWGNNPMPILADKEDNKCCDTCDIVVTQVRMLPLNMTKPLFNDNKELR